MLFRRQELEQIRHVLRRQEPLRALGHQRPGLPIQQLGIFSRPDNLDAVGLLQRDGFHGIFAKDSDQKPAVSGLEDFGDVTGRALSVRLQYGFQDILFAGDGSDCQVRAEGVAFEPDAMARGAPRQENRMATRRRAFQPQRRRELLHHFRPSHKSRPEQTRRLITYCEIGIGAQEIGPHLGDIRNGNPAVLDGR